MSTAMTIAQFNALSESDAAKALHDRSLPLVAEPGQNVFLGYVPVTWDDVATSLEEADDWKEVDIVTEGDIDSALTALRAVYGEAAEIEPR